jgi:hypothetical protein
MCSALGGSEQLVGDRHGGAHDAEGRASHASPGAPSGAPRLRLGYGPGMRISASCPPSRLYVKSG